MKYFMKKYGIGFGYSIALLIAIVLVFASLVVDTIIIIKAHSVDFVSPLFTYVQKGSSVFVWLATIYYGAYGYKVPHGNFLKNLYIIFSLYVGVNLVFCAYYNYFSYLLVFCMVITSTCSSFMAGRLDKIEKNKKIIVLVGILSFIGDVCKVTLFPINIYVITNFNRTVMWFTMSFAYVARYKVHKEAGLLDNEVNSK